VRDRDAREICLRRWDQVRTLRETLAWGCVWLLAAMGMFTACPFAALAQETLPEPPVRSEPESAPKVEMDEPAEAADVAPEKRRLFKRLGPQPVTPEQQEEAERLRKLGAKYGTDPTAIVGRLQLSSQYLDLPQGARAAATVARVDLPFRKDFLLRVDEPFVQWIDPNRPGTTSAQGSSDLSVTAAWRAYNTPEYALLVGVVSTMPTAALPALGTGKYTVGPTIATARFVPRWDSFLIGLFTQQFSVGGDPARKPVNVSKITGQVNSFWGEKWWSIVNALWQVDWEQSAKSSMTIEVEVGRSVVGRLGVYVRPGVGIWGRDLPGAYDWNVEAGVRYMFPSF
jgi:hypothetical protein